MAATPSNFDVRVHLARVQPNFELPRAIGPDLVLRAFGDSDTGKVARFDSFYDGHLVLDATGPRAADRIHAFISALRVGSHCAVYPRTWEYPDGRLSQGGPREDWSWAHWTSQLTEDEVTFVDRHIGVISNYVMPETYSRTGNALALFESALTIEHSYRLPLLGFVGAIESLFSVAKQELSFRLSLSLSKFLATGSVNQRFLFDRARELYGIRSKVAHGDKIDTCEESAAIELAQLWTPQAAQLARASLKTVFERNLTAVFDSRKDHERLMNLLPFADSLDHALDPGFLGAEPTIGRGVNNWLD